MLLDSETYDLVQHVDTLLSAAKDSEFVDHIGPELMQSVIEIATPVCRTAADVDRELRKLRAHVTGLARQRNLRVGSAGTHPFSLFERQRITARDRYRNLVDQLQYIARRELIFGMHVHVAVDDPEKAIKVVSALLDPPLRPPGALGQLALLARRADRALVEPADGLRSLPAERAAAALPRLRGLRRGRRPAREDGLHRRLHAHLVGRAAPSRASALSRCGSWTRSRASRRRSP